MRIIQLSLAALFFYIFTTSALHYKGYSQTNKDYEQQSDIFYRDASVEPVTDYMKERCVLDIYYPKNKQGFPTVVWFHGCTCLPLTDQGSEEIDQGKGF
ncbi:MAG: hypothetical protein PVH48_08905 [Cyclobacteriaceae bacterium]|jgi:hypothetical protein